MSYCRFLWDGSDVYVYDDEQKGIICCRCTLAAEDGDWFSTRDPAQMIVHLAVHVRAGHCVPQYAIVELWRDVTGDSDLEEGK